MHAAGQPASQRVRDRNTLADYVVAAVAVATAVVVVVVFVVACVTFLPLNYGYSTSFSKYRSFKVCVG